MSEVLDLAKKMVELLEKEEGKTELCKLSSLDSGETFMVGEHEFVVLEQFIDGTTAVISKGFMKEDVVFDKESPCYDNSELRKIIEKEIQPIIEKAVGEENIIATFTDMRTMDLHVRDYEDAAYKVRPLTFEEARKYNDLIKNKDLDDWFWTCTPWSTEENSKYGVAVVSPGGFIDCNDCLSIFGVRPFCILKSNIFVSKGE